MTHRPLARAQALGGRLWRAARALAWFEIWGLLNFVAGMVFALILWLVPLLGKLMVMKIIAWSVAP